MRSIPRRLVLLTGLVSTFLPVSFAPGEGQPQMPGLAGRPYAAIDGHALAAPADVETAIPSLAAYLTRPAKSDRDKVRAIFRWVADRVAYDTDAYFGGKATNEMCTAETVLKRRKAICEGYANLFAELCRAAGVQAVKIAGYGRGYGFTPGEPIRTNHAWNAVMLEDRWQLLDVTWAAGWISADKTFTKKFRASRFLPPPEFFIFDHFPEDAKWQLLPEAVTRQEYAKWPAVDLDFLDLGVPAAELRKTFTREDFRGFVQVYKLDGAQIRLHKAPLEKHLQVGLLYHFQIEAPDCLALVMNHNGRTLTMIRRNGVYEAVVRLTPGTLHVGAVLPGKGNTPQSFLVYQAQ